MNLQINYKHLAAEFVIVVVGVAVALAADGWREDLAERAIESEYIERLLSDLNFGRDSLKDDQNFLRQANQGSVALLKQLESDGEQLDEEAAIINFAYAARTGGSSEQFRHNLTYQELISTGRLHYITNPEVRSAIASYFTLIDSLSLIRDDLPRVAFDKFRELAGSSPIFFTDRGYEISNAEKVRLLEEVSGNQSLERDIRYLASRLEFIDGSFQRALQANDDLLGKLQQYIK